MYDVCPYDCWFNVSTFVIPVFPKPVCFLRPSLDELEELWLRFRCIPVVPTGMVVPYPVVWPGIMLDPVYVVGLMFVFVLVVPRPVSRFLARFVSMLVVVRFVPWFRYGSWVYCRLGSFVKPGWTRGGCWVPVWWRPMADCCRLDCW